MTVKKLMDLAADDSASSLVRAEASGALRILNGFLNNDFKGDTTLRLQVQEDIERFLNRPDAVRQPTKPLPTPPGDPIGGR